MVSYKSLFLIKGMTFWNGVTDWISSWKETLWSLGESIAFWFHAERSSWYLYPDSLFPIPYSMSYGLEKVEWLYRPKERELIYMGSADPIPHRVDWLSARVVSSTRSKEMDTFLNDLRIYTRGIKAIPTTVFLQAWSIEDKRWWMVESKDTRLEWIDPYAEEHTSIVTDLVSIPLLTLSRTDSKKKN